MKLILSPRSQDECISGMSALFKVAGLCFWFPEGSIPPESFLGTLLTTRHKVEREGDWIILKDINPRAMSIIHDYLVRGTLPDPDHLHILDAFQIDLYHSYTLASRQEEFMRQYMYDPEYQQDEINTDPYYGLVEITEELWSSLKIGSPKDSDLLFTQKSLEKRPWVEIQTSLKQVAHYCKPKVFMAGGRIFSALFGTRSNDIDLFFHGVDEKAALDLIYGVYNHFYNPCVTRTANALTFATRWTKEDVAQVVLRLYRTPSEVLHGFDVDCCALGYDGEKIWASHRALYALTHGYNTVNFGRLSPSYEHRLVKYGTRGMAIFIPNFSRDKIKVEKMENRWSFWKEDVERYTSGILRYRRIKGKVYHNPECYPQLHGLDILLYLENHCKNYKWNKRTAVAVERLAAESSDYSPVPYTKYGDQGSCIEALIDAIISSASLYPEKAVLYMPHLLDLSSYDSFLEYPPRITEAEKCTLSARTNSLQAGGFSFIHLCIEKESETEALLNIPDSIYMGLGAVFPWKIPQKLQWKTINPGEQMTGTFHRLVLDDVSVWYKGHYYSH